MTRTASTAPDPITTQQRAGWGAQARHFYAQQEVIERQWGVLSDGLLELARVAAGDRVLDLACGVGDPALAAAARVGPTGTVIATDLSPDMLAFAARRCGRRSARRGPRDGRGGDRPARRQRRRGPVAAGSDVRPRPRRGPRRRPSGAGAGRPVRRRDPVAARGPGHAASDRRDPGRARPAADAPPVPGQPGIFSLADASVVRAALERAGLSGIRITPYTTSPDYRSPDEWLDFLLALNVPRRQRLTGVSDDRVRAARQAAADTAAPDVQEDGHVRFPAHGYYATASRRSL